MPNYLAYPVMEIHLKQIEENAEKVVQLCKSKGIQVCGVVKSAEDYAHGYKGVAEAFLNGGCTTIGDSRLNTILRMREMGITAPVLLLRLPMLSEIPEVIQYTDMSLNSQRITLEALYQEAKKQKKIHGVILMVDLGDLREGYFEEEELLADALYLEKKLASDPQEQGGLHFLGIGTNLGCYGAIKPDEENLGRLVSLAGKIEDQIGRKLEIVSGGASSTMPMVKEGKVPEGINHLRVGEAILNNRDLPDLWKVSLGDLHNTNYVLHAQVIEVKEKASHPIGEIFIDAFGNRPVYEDKGRRKRALLAMGKRDIGGIGSIIPRLKGIVIEGGSGDHLILDVTDCERAIQVGEILAFDAYYPAMLYANHSASVVKVYI